MQSRARFLTSVKRYCHLQLTPRAHHTRAFAMNHPNRQRNRNNNNRNQHQAHQGRPRHTPASGNAADSVPPHRSVLPGVGVSIILKQDQPTGHQVTGTVSEVLTRGDHPRGVKVRLQDGRVGRVQSLLPSQQNAVTGTLEGAAGVQAASSLTTGRIASRYRDIRLDEEPEEPPSTWSLADYLPPELQREEEQRLESSTETRTETAQCPVCFQFEGDEAAMAHHVAEHFPD